MLCLRRIAARLDCDMPQGHSITPELAEQVRALNAQGMSDPKIAERLSLHRNMVGRVRRKFDIKPTVERHTRFVPTSGQLGELLTASDRAMERKYGINTNTWSRVRRKYGIEHFRRPTSEMKPAVKDQRSTPFRSQAGTPYIRTFDIPPPDHSVAGEAARLLRTERWVVVNGAIQDEPGVWYVGRMRMTTEEMVAMAVRKGLIIRPWMGVAG